MSLNTGKCITGKHSRILEAGWSPALKSKEKGREGHPTLGAQSKQVKVLSRCWVSVILASSVANMKESISRTKTTTVKYHRFTVDGK